MQVDRRSVETAPELFLGKLCLGGTLLTGQDFHKGLRAAILLAQHERNLGVFSLSLDRTGEASSGSRRRGFIRQILSTPTSSDLAVELAPQHPFLPDPHQIASTPAAWTAFPSSRTRSVGVSRAPGGRSATPRHSTCRQTRAPPESIAGNGLERIAFHEVELLLPMPAFSNGGFFSIRSSAAATEYNARLARSHLDRESLQYLFQFVDVGCTGLGRSLDHKGGTASKAGFAASS